MSVHEEEIAVLHIDPDAVLREAEPALRCSYPSAHREAREALVQIALVGVDAGGVRVVDRDGREGGARDDPLRLGVLFE
jgi:hypothetical protein